MVLWTFSFHTCKNQVHNKSLRLPLYFLLICTFYSYPARLYFTTILLWRSFLRLIPTLISELVLLGYSLFTVILDLSPILEVSISYLFSEQFGIDLKVDFM